MQIAFDATFNILDVAKWPGSTHDPRILMESGLKREAPCTSWVSYWVTVAIPARRLDSLSQSTTGSTVKVGYNIAHKNTRNLVERGIGQMKRRFHVLHGEIRLSPERASILQ
ncbi:hypothetical protein N1851_030516 [Merluccius polli]|uniref:DDE Tnp4 domain-containing protein n=1 Tax=Merluccius polli TaxID=89951 RepID=A0AA47M5B9_MERPO|nr:hypothetical protein N1851_030516 [Merluccius polli]